MQAVTPQRLRKRGQFGNATLNFFPHTTMSQPFQLVSPYQPAGDQPQAIARLAENIVSGSRSQVLLGVTGSGKTF
ncbi:MAG TPA: hypothetical protein DEB25_01965, partial [Desulfobulbaceae bacterium]|nr:hypothetical protein [Desulfobulbaceae bacterium]